MRATTIDGPGNLRVEEVPDPVIRQPRAMDERRSIKVQINP
jgi:hypothetical protein